MSASAPSSKVDRIKSISGGVRYFDFLALMACPTLGAAVAIRQPGVGPLVRLAIFSAFNLLFAVHLCLFSGYLQTRRKPDAGLPGAVILGLDAVLAALSLAGFFFISPVLFAVGIFLTLITGIYSHPSINLMSRPAASALVLFVGATLYFLGGFLAFSHPTAAGLVAASCLGVAAAGLRPNTNVDGPGRARRLFSRGFFAALAVAILMWRALEWWW